MSKSAGDSSKTGADAAIAGKIEIDGSSTVYPISQAVAEEFMKEHPKVTVRVNISGTGGGFKRFKDGDLDICDASRPIEKNELEACQKNNVAFVNLKIGIDGISVVVNPQNTWCKSLTVEQLKSSGRPGARSRLGTRSIRAFPIKRSFCTAPIPTRARLTISPKSFAASAETAAPTTRPTRTTTCSFREFRGMPGRWAILASPITSSTKRRFAPFRLPPRRAPVAPSDETILSGQYKPLSRPLFLYVNEKALARPEIVAFVKFYLDRGPSLVKEVHYIPLPAKEYEVSRARSKRRSSE